MQQFCQFCPLASISLLSPRPQLDEETLSDLTWAFIAIDLNHSGTIDAHEMSCVLAVLAGDLHVKKDPAAQHAWAKKNVTEIMANAKLQFKQYRKEKDLPDLPDEYQYPAAINPDDANCEVIRTTEIYELETEMTKKERKRHQKLEETYGQAHKSSDPVLTKFFSTAGKDVLKMSKKVVLGAKEVAKGVLDRLPPDELHFAEFVYMCQSRQLDDLFPDHDWKASVKRIHQLRRAFDTADVDGDDTLEQGEFELVVDTLHIGHDLTQEDIAYCWDVLIGCVREQDPDHENHLSFTEFVVAVLRLMADERIGDRLDLTRETPWTMLSLLVDTPVSKAEEQRLTRQLTSLERLGLAMVKGTQYPMNRDKIKEVLKQCVDGNLRELTDGKRERLNTVWWHCVLQALMIGFIACGISSPAENLFVYWFRNDGLVDIDCVCYTRGCMTNPGSLGIADEDLAPGDTTIPGSFVDAFKSSAAFSNADPCETGYAEVVDGDGDVQVPYSCTFHDFSQAVVEHGDAVKDWCDVTACQPMPGGWNREAKNVDPADGVTLIDQPAWEAARNCSARRNATCGFKDAWTMGTYKPGKDPATGLYYGQGDVIADECWTNPWAALWFWVFCMSVVILCCVVEIGLLMYYGVYHSMRVAWALGYRLSPLNEDRAFLADALVRGAFELGNPENRVLGVDPTAEVGEATRWRIALVIFLWKGKIVLCAAVMKFIWGCVFPWHTAVWVKPWLSMPSDMFWNAMTAHIVITQAQIRGVGFAVAHECFNEIMGYGEFKQASMTELHKLQTARAIGVAIVKHGNLYPSMEVLLRHGISWMKMQSSPAVMVKEGQEKILDNAAAFVADMKQLSRDEQIAVLCVHLLTGVLDGNANTRLRESFKAALEVQPARLLIRTLVSIKIILNTDVRGQQACEVPEWKYSTKRLKFVAQEFRNLQKPLKADMLRQAFMFDEYPHVDIKECSWHGYHLREWAHCCTEWLTI